MVYRQLNSNAFHIPNLENIQKEDGVCQDIKRLQVILGGLHKNKNNKVKLSGGERDKEHSSEPNNSLIV